MNDKTNVFQALIKRDPAFLDRPLEELLPMRFMGGVAVDAYRGLIKRLNSLPLSLEERKAKIQDGQDAGKALLMIEAKIGELLPAPKEAKSSGAKRARAIQYGALDVPPAAHLGMTRGQASRARTIANHPEVVAEVIKEAEENDDIPTRSTVLNKVAYRGEKNRIKGSREKTQLEMAADAYFYYSKLLEANHLIPTEPPKELREKDFLKIKAIALLILKKLEVLNEGTKIKSPPEPKSLPGPN